MWTNIFNLKALIQSAEVSIPTRQNVRIFLEDYDESQLPDTAISEDSETVKNIIYNEPQADSSNPITLNGTVEVALDFPKIVWDTVLVSSDLLLTTVYIENRDYVIDYFVGKISRADPTPAAPTIADGGAVYVWYLPFNQLISGTDYDIDYSAGTIVRRAGGDIANKSSVWIDYTHSNQTPTDNAITECIREAQSFILPRLKSPYDEDSDDEGLRALHTNLSMYYLCLSQTFKELNNARIGDSDKYARRWRELAGSYLSLAMALFSKYLKITASEAGGLIQNRFPSSRTRTYSSPVRHPNTRRY